MKLEKLMPGMIVYDVGRMPMGNTTLKTVAVWKVKVIEVDLDRRLVVASWNGNPCRTYYQHSIKNWRVKPPMLVRTFMGAMRIATREEQKIERSILQARGEAR
jgi:hypothetical protein